jgi:2-oxoglutarate dehydrogenase dihydrolipoamide succinyltransferase (E2 component)
LINKKIGGIMATKVIMPQLGESVNEGTITKWLKAPGENVEEYEPLVEVNTDKVDTEIPSPGSGIVLATLVATGTTVHAGTLLAWIGQPGEIIPGEEGSPLSASPTPVETVPESLPNSIVASVPATDLGNDHQGGSYQPPVAGRDRNLGFISPVVARIASEYAIDLSQVKGTGQEGRITKKDVLAFIEKRGLEEQETGTTQISITPSSPNLPAVGDSKLIPMTTVRRAIADHMVMSKHTSPHVTTIMEVDLSCVVAHRNANKDSFAREGVNLTFTAYFIASIVTALKTFPIVNSSWTEKGILMHRQINIGMATSLGEEGLIVPVIKNADGLSLLGLARTINDLASRARAKKLQPDEVKGGTFTITNHGISGSLFATPIINQPQCGILGVGAIQKRVVVINDKNLGDVMAIRPMVYVGFTFDHRILDGAIADYFLKKAVDVLQYWS